MAVRFVNTRRPADAVSLREALIEGLAPGGGLYVPETIDQWPEREIERLPTRTLT